MADHSGDSVSDPSLERRTIPSINPERTWTPGDDRESGSGAATGQRNPPIGSVSELSSSENQQQADRVGGQPNERLAEVESELENARARIATLESERDDLRDERDDLQAELERLRQQRDELQTEIETLRQQVSTLESRAEQGASGRTTAETSLTTTEAIDGTDLFVRYRSKGDETLKTAHSSSADPEDVNDNLNLEYHTQFDAAETDVDGQPYEAFLVETIHYRFVEWLVRNLLYEIRDSGRRSALSDLYDALPLLDRIELNAAIEVESDEEQPAQETFDIVLRDRMGNPLAIASLNESRSAVTDEMMTTLVTAATRVGESSERFAGAFVVTSSFFDPDALETASEATGGGILSRDKRESFIRLSRKDGFHLCLVESRDEDFHLTVPEL